jgi:hypothetical protein
MLLLVMSSPKCYLHTVSHVNYKIKRIECSITRTSAVIYYGTRVKKELAPVWRAWVEPGGCWAD